MVIRQAEIGDYDAVRAFYHNLIDNSRNLYVGWKKDIYPSPDFLSSSIEAGELFTGMEEKILAAMVLNHLCNEGYGNYDWTTRAEPEEVLVIHALGVDPERTGQGLGRQMARFAVERARETGMKAIRLDVLKGNVPAERLYKSLGFQHLHTLEMYYEDTGWTDFDLYELVL